MFDSHKIGTKICVHGIRLTIPQAVHPDGLEQDLRVHALQQGEAYVPSIVADVDQDPHLACLPLVNESPACEGATNISRANLEWK